MTNKKFKAKEDLTLPEDAKEQWVSGVRAFQKLVSGHNMEYTRTSKKTLEAEWDSWGPKKKARELRHIKDHLAIMRATLR